MMSREWTLEDASYKDLQHYAKCFNIRANSKAAKLRKELSVHVEEIRRRRGAVSPPQPDSRPGHWTMENVTFRRSEPADSARRLNETYSLDEEEEEDKENAPPPQELPMPATRLGDARTRVEENDVAFLIFERLSPARKLQLPEHSRRGRDKSDGTSSSLRRINQSAGGVVGKPKAKEKRLKARMPDFARIHQKAFASMESLCAFSDRRKGVLKTSGRHENSACPEARPARSSLSKSGEPAPHKKKFDLAASLKKKPTWKVHKGPLTSRGVDR